jgi:hypothetical protein
MVPAIEKIIISEIMVENAHGFRVIPSFYTTFHVPERQFREDAAAVLYKARLEFDNLKSGNSLHHFATPSGREAIYVESPSRDTTESVADVVLNSFAIPHIFVYNLLRQDQSQDEDNEQGNGQF